ncbi:MAG: Rieske 2Fe-2S domain-containing protein [Gaiellaceae bacterium]
MADDLEPERHGAEPQHPSPTIWPFAFAGGIALLLVGIVVSMPAAIIGAVIAVVFGFLWIREATREVRVAPPEPEPEPVSELAVEEGDEPSEPDRYPRSVFLEGATLGLGALIGGIVTLPALGFMVLPAFVGQEYEPVDIGPLENFPEKSYVTATFVYKKGEGRLGRRTAFIRNNGLVNEVPSMTIISSRCVHMGCPTQPQGPPGGEPTEIRTTSGPVSLQSVQASGFGCPCHGGAYDAEGNRTAGPPVRALDRYEYSIRNGNLVLGNPYSVAEVDGEGAKARIKAYRLADPGQHVDGIEQIFYPYVP